MEDRREFPRYFFGERGEFSPGSDGPPFDVVIPRISIQGCLVEDSGIPAVGGKGSLAIEWDGRQFQFQAEVVWKGPKGLAGLRFVGLEDEGRVFLRDLCSGLRLVPMGPPTGAK